MAEKICANSTRMSSPSGYEAFTTAQRVADRATAGSNRPRVQHGLRPGKTMEFYIVLGVATLLIGVLTLLISLKTKTIAFAMGAAFLYYWTLFGAFSVLQQKFGDSQERPFDYLFYKMFPVYLD